MRYSNAGSYPPFVISGGRQDQPAAARGHPHRRRGATASTARASSSSRPGDLLVIYTDGFIDQESAEGEPFGEQRLIEFFRNNLQLSVDEHH